MVKKIKGLKIASAGLLASAVYAATVPGVLAQSANTNPNSNSVAGSTVSGSSAAGAGAAGAGAVAGVGSGAVAVGVSAAGAISVSASTDDEPLTRSLTEAEKAERIALFQKRISGLSSLQLTINNAALETLLATDGNFVLFLENDSFADTWLKLNSNLETVQRPPSNQPPAQNPGNTGGGSSSVPPRDIPPPPPVDEMKGPIDATRDLPPVTFLPGLAS